MCEPEVILIFGMGRIVIRVVSLDLVSSFRRNVNRLDCLEKRKKNDSKYQR